REQQAQPDRREGDRPERAHEGRESPLRHEDRRAHAQEHGPKLESGASARRIMRGAGGLAGVFFGGSWNCCRGGGCARESASSAKDRACEVTRTSAAACARLRLGWRSSSALTRLT